MPGDEWEDEIRKAVSASDVILVCLSREAISREGYFHRVVHYVTDAALEQPAGTIYVIPVRLEPCEVPAAFQTLQSADLYEKGGYENLLFALKEAEAERARQISPDKSEETGAHSGKIEVLFSYSHRDEHLRDELDKHLALLKRQKLINNWHDRKIPPGKDFDVEILKHLKTAQLILLLISSDFLSSDYCYTIEMQAALQRQELGEARVIPIILRPVDWQHGPLSKLVALPTDGKPVTAWGKRDAALLNVAIGIRRVVDELTTQ
jgi:hypothetical protein